MNNLITSRSNVNPAQLARDFVKAYSVDETAAINRLRLALDRMNPEDVNRWFEEMAGLFALNETSAEALIALLGVLESSYAPVIQDCHSISEIVW